MCSFIVTNKKINDLSHANELSKLRGPDNTNSVYESGYGFLHNHLHITGDHVTQPFIDSGIFCVYNGEIYNYEKFGNFKNDGNCLIPLYKKYGPAFLKKLDGEFAIALVDFRKNIIVASSDIFACKPIWVATQGPHIGIATYKSSLERSNFKNIKKIPANTAYVYSMKDMKVKSKYTLFKFSLKQHKKHYDGWITAFENAIKKRSKVGANKTFLGLSSGYDSGAISWELTKQRFKFKAFTILSNENEKIIAQRRKLIKDNEIVKFTLREYEKERKHLLTKSEAFKTGAYSVWEDPASMGLSCICRKAVREGYKIYFSGQGSDEIISDYGHGGRKKFPESQFGGLFPKDLNSIFPYRNFFGGTQEWYINKEECVAGSHGVETRYPFLDKNLVQEFLWLDVSYKNTYYKAPLREYFTRNDFAFEQDVKRGFIRAY